MLKVPFNIGSHKNPMPKMHLYLIKTDSWQRLFSSTDVKKLFGIGSVTDV